MEHQSNRPLLLLAIIACGILNVAWLHSSPLTWNSNKASQLAKEYNIDYQELFSKLSDGSMANHSAQLFGTIAIYASLFYCAALLTRPKVATEIATTSESKDS